LIPAYYSPQPSIIFSVQGRSFGLSLAWSFYLFFSCLF
jgi:hypothetical protein